MKYLVGTLSVLSQVTLVYSKEVCHALVLSGGGSNGAWEVGVMWGLSHYATNTEDFAWDVVTGVSAGAINSMAIAGFAPG